MQFKQSQFIHSFSKIQHIFLSQIPYPSIHHYPNNQNLNWSNNPIKINENAEKITWIEAMEARITWTIARTMMTGKSGYGKQWPPPKPAMAEGRWRKVEENGRRRKRFCWTLREKREILYISIYLYVSACKREREIYQHRHMKQHKRILWRGVKWEKRKWICCDFVITMGTIVPAKNYGRFCVEKIRRIFFSLSFSFSFFRI